MRTNKRMRTPRTENVVLQLRSGTNLGIILSERSRRVTILFVFLITSYYLLVTGAAFAVSYPTSCPAEAQSIVDAVGGCASVDKDAYAAVYSQCCSVPAPEPQKSAVFWTVAAVAVGLIAVAVWRGKYKKQPSRN